MNDDSSRHLRVLLVLEQLANTTYPQTLAQLAHRTGLPKTSLMRMLATLEQSAYVTRTPGEIGYVPGPRAHNLALSVLRTPHFLRACRGVLGKLVGIIGESCNLTAPAGDAVQYLARVESTEALRLQLHLEIGVHVPLHCTASGKLFLANTPQHYLRQVLDRIELTALTPKTITNRKALETELEHIRLQNIGIDDEEFVRGMVAIAVPILDSHEAIVAAIACHAPKAQKSLSELMDFTGPMLKAAQAMSVIFSDHAERRTSM